ATPGRRARPSRATSPTPRARSASSSIHAPPSRRRAHRRRTRVVGRALRARLSADRISALSPQSPQFSFNANTRSIMKKIKHLVLVIFFSVIPAGHSVSEQPIFESTIKQAASISGENLNVILAAKPAFDSHYLDIAGYRVEAYDFTNYFVVFFYDRDRPLKTGLHWKKKDGKRYEISV